MDEKTQKVTLITRYGFEQKVNKKNQPYTIVTQAYSIVFDDFLKAYNNFLLKRVGPESRCDKLEIGKLQVNTDKNGRANGYFVGRYIDNMCMFLRFFDSKPRDFDSDKFVLYSAKGITGAKNTFTPAFRNGEFYVHVDTIYEPIEEPSVFGRGGATLSSLYKEKLENFLSDPDFQKLVNPILPEQGEKTNNQGFKFGYAQFLTNKNKKIQLSFVLQKLMNEDKACAFRESLIKTGFQPEQ